MFLVFKPDNACLATCVFFTPIGKKHIRHGHGTHIYTVYPFWEQSGSHKLILGELPQIHAFAWAVVVGLKSSTKFLIKVCKLCFFRAKAGPSYCKKLRRLTAIMCTKTLHSGANKIQNICAPTNMQLTKRPFSWAMRYWLTV